MQYHEKKHETLYLLEGKCLFTLEDDDGNLVEAEMGPGDIRVVAPGKKQDFFCPLGY